MTDDVVLGTPLTLEPGKTYVVTVPYRISLDQVRAMKEHLATICPEAKFIILDSGIQIAREAE